MGSAELGPSVGPSPGPSSHFPVPREVPDAWDWGCLGAPSAAVFLAGVVRRAWAGGAPNTVSTWP